MPGKAPSGSAN